MSDISLPTVYKIAAPFEYNGDFNDKVMEFNILFYKSRNKLEDLIEFVQEYEDKTINIMFPEGVHVPTMKSIYKVSKKVRVRLKAEDSFKVQELKENNIPFFFDSTMPIYNKSALDAYIKLGVCAVYVADDLCYDMEDVSKICKLHSVQLRIVLNHIPSTVFDKGINPHSPIYMPKDFHMLDEYYDIFEFDCGEPYDWAKFDVLFRAWFINHKWSGEMFEINEDVEQHFNCNFIYPDFTKFKLNCGLRCVTRNVCHKCEQFLSIGDTLKAKEVRFVE